MGSEIARARKMRNVETMKKNQTQSDTPRLMRAKAANLVLGGEIVTRHCVKSGWLAPKVKKNRLTIYSAAEVHLCATRIERGEYPGT